MCIRDRSFTSLVEKVPLAPADKILGLTAFYNRDPNPKKINLTVGVYQDAWGKVTTFPSVAKSQKLIDNDLLLNKNLSYLPITGCKDFETNVMNFLFKESMHHPELIEQDRISFIQTLSGTGAVAIAASFLSTFITNEISVPNYSWANHTNIFTKNGFPSVDYYPYYDRKTGQIDFQNWINHLKNLPFLGKPRGILLHASCHNPTGLDPTRQQWEKIIDTIYELKMIPVIDMAYQGLETGNLIEDAHLLRLCLNTDKYPHWNNGIFLCQSFAKNMGLYGERVGSLSIVLPEADSQLKERVNSQLKRIVRGIYSSPPGYGSRIANVLLSTPNLKKQWFKDVKSMVERLQSVRLAMFERLNWPDLINKESNHGMFYFTRFSEGQVNELRTKYGIYLTLDGRLSLSGVNNYNVDYLCEALQNVSKLARA